MSKMVFNKVKKPREEIWSLSNEKITDQRERREKHDSWLYEDPF